MLLARYAPVGSQRYEKLAQSIKSFDKIIEWLPAQLFAIWSIFVAGMAAGKAQTDRYYFWDWSDWLIGIVGLFVIALIYFPMKKSLKIEELDKLNFMKNSKSTIYYFIFGIVLFSIGWFITGISNINELVLIYPTYLCLIGGILLVYSIKNDNKIMIDTKYKIIQSGFGIFFLILCILSGFMMDDPVIATTAIVSLPFLIVLLFGKHVRHLERAKFYPIFIFAMFVTTREAWFLIPLFLLFFILRSYNYLRYQKVYPTFGVTDDQS